MSDAIYSAPGSAFFSELDNADTGAVGTLGVRILRKSDGAEVLARTTAGITEVPASSGRYVFAGTAPADAGDYTVLWDTGSVSPTTTAADDLVVTFDLPGPPAPLAGGAYASVEAVEALNKGRPPFPATQVNGQSSRDDVERWLAESAGVMDGLLRERGFVVPIPTGAATSALKTLEGFNAIGAAYFVERAAKTSDRRKEALAMWESAQKMLGEGLVQLDLPVNDESHRPRSGYGRTGPAATPYFSRGMQL